MRAALSAFLRTRLARVVSLTAAALLAARCHSEPTAVCTPTSLAFTAQPSSVAAGTGISLTVEARDNSGTLATCFKGNVTVAIGTNPGGGTLSGTTTVAASSGIASFSGLTITKAGAGYTLTVNGVGIATAATSTAFTITAGPATALAFTTQPATANAGASITAIVTARDNFGNTAASFTGNLAMTIGTNPGSGTLGGTATVAAIAGIATFSNLTINKIGVGYTLIATPAAGAPPAAVTSSAFNINPGPVAKLAFTAQPSNTAAGASIAPTIQVTAQDANGNTTPTFTGTVTVALAANPGAGTLSGTLAVAAIGGVASFTDLKINKPAAGYTLSASATSLTTATSTAFTISLGPLAQLIFSAQPTNTVAGAAVTPAVTVTGQDAAGNTVTSFTGNVTVGIGTNPGSGTLSGSLTKAAVAGVATFNDLSIEKSGTGYTLTATSGGASQATSNAFNVTPAAAAKLSFTVQPVNTAAGSSIPTVQVTALDLNDNVATSFTGNVTVTIGTNANAGTLSGTTTIAAAAGIATFSTLSIDSAGTGYTLTATAASLTDATSSTFNIVPGTATHLVFTQQPTNATAGVGIAPAVKVTALDAKGNVATAYTANVTVAIGTNPGSGTLSGTATVAAAAGVATFSGLSINKSGTGYTLTTSSGALTGATSASFNIVAAAATHLVMTTQPVNTGAGASITPAVVVAAQDAFGNTDLTYTANVVMAIGTNPSSGTLSGTLTRAAAAGVATFNDLSINLVGTGYTLGATSGALTAATSNAFNIFANTATHLIFFVQPGNTVAGVAIAPAVVVQALDGSNNVASGFTGGITITFGNNAGGGTLSGTTVVTAAAGIASFSTLSINKTGDGYTLAASAGGVTGATSNGFKITPAAATHLAFGQAPTNTTAGASITPAVTARALDAFDNLDTAYTANVDLAIGTNPGGGTLSGTTPVAAANGTATFSNLSINKSGTGYTLHATSGTLTDVNSGTFNISSAALSQLVFTQQPTNTSAGATISPNVLVAGQDAFGNTVTSFTGIVDVVIGTNPGSGTLSGTTSVSAIAGVATFSNLSIDKAGSGYSLTASATGASDGASASFDIAAGAATILTFTAQPASSTTAGTSIAPPLTVAAQDAQGNTDPNFTGNITVAIGTNGGTPTAGTLSGTTNIAATAGVATFSNLSIDKAGPGYTLTASSGVLTSATSNSFAIAAGAATKLAFTVPPVTTTAGTAIPAISVSAQDALGNTDPSYTASVSVAITGGTGKTGAALSGTASHAAVSGVAGFSGLSIDSAGTGYTLTATSGSLTDVVSGAFDINAGAVTQLLFTVQPTNVAAGVTITPNVTLVAKDAIGNINTAYTSTVTLTLPVNPGGAAVGNGVLAASGGTVTFSGLFLDKVGTGYKLQASDGSVSSSQSSAFNVTPGAVDHLAFTVQPTNATSNAIISPAVKVTAQDVFNNTVTSFASNITVAIGIPNPVGGTLSGTRTRAAIAGVATFSTLSIDAVNDSIIDGNYTLAATSGVLPTATSNTFNIIPSVATRLFFKVQPPNATTAGATMTSFSVEARDASGQVVTGYGDPVTLTITSNTGTPGATLGGTVTQAAVTGTATFTDITLDKTASNYKLTASATGVTEAISAYFKIDPDVPDKLVFSVQPSNANESSLITPQIEVKAIDQFANVVTGFTDNVTLTISDPNASGGTLSGLTTKAAVAGVATFSNLSINIAQTGHTLDASTPTAFTSSNTVTSNSFDIIAGTVNHLGIKTPPTATTAGQTIPTVTVVALDAVNDTLTGFSGQVTVSITAGTGTSGATLSGTKTVTASGGFASFTDLSIDKKGTGYRLSFTAVGLSGVTSNSFAINSGPATKLSFLVDPASGSAGVAITPVVVVEVEDALGNPVSGFVGDVSLSIFANPGGGTLSGSSTATVGNGQLVAGVASFSDLSIDAVGVGYRLQASSSGLASDVSTAFQVTAGTADHLVFTVAPSDRTAGLGITPAIRVTAFDALGNVATGFGDDITVAITSGTGTFGAVLSGVTTVTAGSGTAQFSGLSIDKAGSGYTLSATTTNLAVTGTTSATFTITAAAAHHLTFTVQPSNTAADSAISPAVEVSVRDLFENTVTTFVGNVTLAIGTNADGGGTVLSGTKIKAVSNGVATFNDLSINHTGVGFTLTAQTAALPIAISSGFNIF